jgi:hypothetical protein
MRATAKDAAEQGCVPLVMERAKSVDLLIKGEVRETRRVEAKEMNCEESLGRVNSFV